MRDLIHLIYADDVILYSYIYSMDDCYKLQKDLDSLTKWSHKWQMFFNPRKCKFLRITNKKNFISFTYHINDCSIQEVTHAKYLGVVLDQHLSWNDHIKKTASKAIKVIGFLQRNLYQCPPLVKSIFTKPWLDLSWNIHQQFGTLTHQLISTV